MLLPYFVYIAHFTKFARGSSLIMEKNFAQGKIKSGRKSMVKKKEKKRKKKKTGPKEKVRVPFSQEKKKNSFVKANGTDGAPRWRPDF